MEQEPLDLFLVNGFTPLRRSPGDVFLDNGLGILRAYLNQEGIRFIIEDHVGIEGYREFDLPRVTRPLRRLLDALLYGSKKRRHVRQMVDALRTRLLFSILRRHYEAKMRAYLNQLLRRIIALRPAIVGMKVWFGSTFDYCEKLCTIIRRECPEMILVAGGPHANCYHHEGMILRHSKFDLAIYSEGERALAEVVRIARKYPTKMKRLNAIREAEIPNLVLGHADDIREEPIMEMPINEKFVPEYTDHELANKVRSHTLIDALGCDYGRCNFCIHPKIHPRFQMRDPALVVNEIEIMLERGIGFFTFTASNTPMLHALRICQEILNRGLTIEFTMLMRGARRASQRQSQLVESFRLLIRAGLRILYLGVEAGNDDILKEVFNKDLTVQEIEATVECLRKASNLEGRKVFLITSFIYPLPLTDALLTKRIDLDEVLEEDIRLAKRMGPDSFQVMPAIVYPGVKWHDEAEKFNIEIERNEFARSMLRLEMSPHLLKSIPATEPYRINGKGMDSWAEHYLKICRRANEEGLATELNDEHLVVGLALGCQTQEELQQLSKDIFLDILSGQDEKSRGYFHRVNEWSRELAESNRRHPNGRSRTQDG